MKPLITDVLELPKRPIACLVKTLCHGGRLGAQKLGNLTLFALIITNLLWLIVQPR
jgi:hypothetical protein